MKIIHLIGTSASEYIRNNKEQHKHSKLKLMRILQDATEKTGSAHVSENELLRITASFLSEDGQASLLKEEDAETVYKNI